MKNILRSLSAPLLCGVLSGCGVVQSITGWGQPTPTEKVIEAVTSSNETLTVLSAIGGLCLLAGMLLLCLSRGTMGWRPIIGGVLLIVLNYVIAEYADWIFIPVIIATGCISAAWGWSVFKRIWNKEYKNECDN
jgi:CHASE2 domain-containing sensor protein